MIRLLLERRALNKSQSELARDARMHVSSVSQIETGRLKPWPGQARKLAAALGWPEDRAGELFEEVRDEHSIA